MADSAQLFELRAVPNVDVSTGVADDAELFKLGRRFGHALPDGRLSCQAPAAGVVLRVPDGAELPALR
jgi:hypothetical protein